MTDMFLYPGEANPNDVKLTDPTVLNSSGSIIFAQFAAVCLAVTSANATLVKSGAATLSGVASVGAASELKLKGAGALSGSGITQAAAHINFGGGAASVAQAAAQAKEELVSGAISQALARTTTAAKPCYLGSGEIDLYIGFEATANGTLLGSEAEDPPQPQPKIVYSVNSGHSSSAIPVRYRGQSKSRLSQLTATANHSVVRASDFSLELPSFSISGKGNVTNVVDRSWPNDKSKARLWASQMDDKEALELLGLVEFAGYPGGD